MFSNLFTSKIDTEYFVFRRCPLCHSWSGSKCDEGEPGRKKGNGVDGKRTCTKHTGAFEWEFEVVNSGFSEDVDSDGFGVLDVLGAHEGLDERGLREVEVKVHEAHHGDTVYTERSWGDGEFEQDRRRWM